MKTPQAVAKEAAEQADLSPPDLTGSNPDTVRAHRERWSKLADQAVDVCRVSHGTLCNSCKWADLARAYRAFASLASHHLEERNRA